MSDGQKPPSRLNLLREMTAGLDMVGAPLALARARVGKSQQATGRHVIVLPGFGANDVSTAPLRYFLTQQGHEVEGWGQGFNTAGRGLINDINELSDRWDVDRSRENAGEAEVPALCDALTDYVQARSEALGRPIALVGWSLGGYVAREAARDLPDQVDAVVTMGSPVKGGPKYTSVAPYFRSRGLDLDWIEEEVDKRFDRPITQPITAIYSKRDGVVGWRSSIDDQSPNIRHIEVNVSHFGLGFNAKVWRLVRDALRV